MSAFASHALVGSRFVVDREVGRGGVGVVYKAQDTLSDQSVALKVIAISGVDAGEEARFRREGRVLAGLRHPGIVRVVDFGALDEGQPYVAMEWLEGEDIAQRQRRAPMALGQCLEVAAQVADALAAAHAAGIVHRDVKPSNVILVGSGPDAPKDAPVTAKLVDFGVAAAGDAKLTHTGAIIGTPAYMAPEQARGEASVDARADLYSLGATLFEMLAHRPPHVGPTPIAILARLVTTPPPRLSDLLPDVPTELDDLTSALLAPNPEDRPPSATDVAERLREVARGTCVAGPPVVHMSETPESAPQSVVVSSAGGSRVITSILATQVPKGSPRARLIAHLRARGAEATELGGDAIVAHLGARRALGDEATRALDLALRLAKVNAAVGVATGRTKLERARPMGEVVDRAAALARDAQRGQVLADTTTTELARGRYELQVRDDGAAVVTGAMPGAREQVGGAPFVGRDAELAQILGSFERAIEDQAPVIVTVTGAPGMGKTRLRREVLLRISSHSVGARVVLARCEAFAQNHPLGVVADIARAMAGVGKGVSLADAGPATDALVGASGAIVAPDAHALVARLLAHEALQESMVERATRDALWLALTDISVGLARRSPLCIGIEDGQWADAESLLWLDHLLARAAGTPLWILATTRPGFSRDAMDRFAARDHLKVELRPMSRRYVRAIARAVLGDHVVTAQAEQVADSIAGQSGGSPLFAEELARITAHGRDAASAPTIEAAMQVQLDALDDRARDAATRLAVFGLVGWDQGLAALGVADAVEMLRSLAQAEIVVERASARFAGTREWAFKHALMREVAYASLGDDALHDMHAHAGRWLAKVGEDDATVARHFELGNEHERAAEHLEKAAMRALAAHALSEAVRMAEKSLAFANDKQSQFARAQILDEAWNRLDARAGERETAVRAMEDAVHDAPSDVRARGARVRYEDACGGGPDTSARLDQVRIAAQEAHVADEEARCAAALAARYAFAGELHEAAEVAEHLLILAQEHQIAGAAVDAWQTLAVVRQARGDVGAALEARRSAARAACEAGLKMREATLTINVGFALTTVGARAEARVAIEGGLALAQAIGSPGTVRHGQMNLMCWTATFGTDPSADRLLVEPRATADAAATGSWTPHDRATLGVLYYRGLERLREEGTAPAKLATTLLTTAAQGYRATKMLDVLPVALGHLAEAKRRCGDAAAARALATEATTLLDQGSPSLLNEAPAFLALHDACFDMGERTQAREAIAHGMPRLVTRVRGLAGTQYAADFLRNIACNAGLLAAADGYGLMPDALREVLEGRR